jgi:spore coat protein CotH
MLVLAGRSYGPVGVRLKGMNSFEPIDAKPSLRISIDQYAAGAEVFGLRDLTLDNMHSDPSMMHERLAYWVARMAGVPSSRSNHAMVTINGQLYGLYANVETVKKRMVGRWFADSSGSLYEATDVDFTAALVPGYSLEGGADDRRLLTGLASALTAPTGDAAIDAAGAYANLAEFRRYWAMCSVIGQFDSMPYSEPGDDYFVYGDPQSGRLWFMPWGMDETFLSPEFDVQKVVSVLARACKASAGCVADYAHQTWDILAMVEQMDWIAEHDRVAAQIAPFTVMDRRKAYSDDDVVRFQNAMAEFMANRRSWLQSMLPGA